VEDLVRTTDLGQQMKSMGVWDEWANGKRGRKAGATAGPETR
jgi:carboxypeptidase Q